MRSRTLNEIINWCICLAIALGGCLLIFVLAGCEVTPEDLAPVTAALEQIESDARTGDAEQMEADASVAGDFEILEDEAAEITAVCDALADEALAVIREAIETSVSSGNPDAIVEAIGAVHQRQQAVAELASAHRGNCEAARANHVTRATDAKEKRDATIRTVERAQGFQDRVEAMAGRSDWLARAGSSLVNGVLGGGQRHDLSWPTPAVTVQPHPDPTTPGGGWFAPTAGIGAGLTGFLGILGAYRLAKRAGCAITNGAKAAGASLSTAAREFSPLVKARLQVGVPPPQQ